MDESATENRRERRMRDTAARLTSVCRQLTAAHGLGGFTIDQVCEQADISRRTFFNYFPSKEDAVLGGNPEEDAHEFAAQFLARPSGDWGRVLDDLTEIAVAHFESAGVDAAERAELGAAIEREPALLLRFMGVSREVDRRIAELIAEREGLDADDPRPGAAVSIFATLMRSTAERFLDPTNDRTFASILAESLSAMREVLQPELRKATL